MREKSKMRMLIQMTQVSVKILWKKILSVENLQTSYLFNGQFFTIIQCYGPKLTANAKTVQK